MTRNILLSLDVEEFDIPEEYGQTLDPDTKIQVSGAGLKKVLDLLDSLDITVTCFTTVFFAKNQPDLMRRIIDRHELASHGVSHSGLHADDFSASRLALETLSGREVCGFRKPRLGKVDSEEVKAAGYLYNSSENPIYLPGRYMNFFKPRLPHISAGLVNLPISCSPVIRYPLFWLSFKNSPEWLYREMSRWTLRNDGYLNIFFHSWEFADLTPWQLPRFVKYPSGEHMLIKFEKYLTWLNQQGRFTTHADFARSFLADSRTVKHL